MPANTPADHTPPEGGTLPDATPQPAAVLAGPALVPRSLKTKTDRSCGIVFLILGLLAMGLFGYQITDAFVTLTELFAGYTLYDTVVSVWDVNDLQHLSLPLLFTAVGSLLALVAGLLLTLSGIFSLKSGKGRKPAYAAVVFMLFTILLDAATLYFMHLWDTLPMATVGETILASLWVYLFEVLFVLIVMIMLPFKKLAKKKAKEAQPLPVAIAAGGGVPLADNSDAAPQPPSAVVAAQPGKNALKAAKQQAKAEKKAADAEQKQAKADAKAARAAKKQAQAEMNVVKAAEKQMKLEEQAAKAAEKQAAAVQNAEDAANQAAAKQAEAAQAAARAAAVAQAETAAHAEAAPPAPEAPVAEAPVVIPAPTDEFAGEAPAPAEPALPPDEFSDPGL